jgi:hypothetical protein
MRLLFIPVLCCACAGGVFNLQPQLQAREALEVKGMAPVSTGACAQGNTKTSIELQEAGMVQLGDLALFVAPAKTETRSEVLEIELIRSVRSILQRSESVLKLSQASVKLDVDALLQLENEKLRRLQGSVSQSVAVEAKPEVKDAAGKALLLVEALQATIRIPKSATQDATLPFVAYRNGRRVVGACHSVNRAQLSATFAPSTFSLSCTLVPEQDAQVRTLSANGIGSWANYGFTGSLRTSKEILIFRSQNISVLGTGVVRGFEFNRGSEQVAAMSFYGTQTDYGRDAKYAANAWLQPLTTEADDDVLATTTALSYLYPWPTQCDVGALSQKAK